MQWVAYDTLTAYEDASGETMRQLLRDEGLVIITGIFSPAEIEERQQEVEAWLWERGVDVKDSGTWRKYNTSRFPFPDGLHGMLAWGAAELSEYVPSVAGPFLRLSVFLIRTNSHSNPAPDSKPPT